MSLKNVNEIDTDFNPVTINEDEIIKEDDVVITKQVVNSETEIEDELNSPVTIDENDDLHKVVTTDVPEEHEKKK